MSAMSTRAPSSQWQQWYDQASEARLCRAQRVRAVDGRRPMAGRSRATCLARGADERGFSFFTNYESAKSAQLMAEPRAAMLFTWLQLHRQVRVVGVVERLPEAESDAVLRIASSVVADRERGRRRNRRCCLIERRSRSASPSSSRPSPTSSEVPRPAYWGGWLLRRCRTSSGRAGPADCTTVSAIAPPKATVSGSSSGWLRSPHFCSVDETVDQRGHRRNHHRVIPICPDRAGATDTRR